MSSEDVSSLFGGSGSAVNFFDSFLEEELAIPEEQDALYPTLPAPATPPPQQPPQPMQQPMQRQASYFGTPSSPPTVKSPKFESTLQKKQVDAYDPPMARPASLARKPTTPTAQYAPFTRPPSVPPNLRTFSPPPLSTSSPLNPARPPSRGHNGAQPAAVARPPPPPVKRSSDAAPTRVMSPVPPPLAVKPQEAVRSPIPDLAFQPPSPLPAKTQPMRSPSPPRPPSPAIPEASPTTDAWGIEETMPLDEEGWGFDEEIDLDAITLEPPPSAAVVQPAPVVAEPKVEESAADVENRAKQEQPPEANEPPPQAAQPSPAPEPAKSDEMKIKQETPEPEPLPDVSPTFSDDPWGTNDIKVEEEELPRPPEDVQEGAALQPKTTSVDVNGAEVGPEEPDLPEEAAAQDNFNQQLELEPPVHEYQAAQPESAEPASSSATVEPESEESKTGWPDVAEQELAGLDAEPNGAEPADDSPSDDTIIVRPEEVGGETPESADEDAYEQELPVPASLARDAEPNRTPVAPQEGFPRKTTYGTQYTPTGYQSDPHVPMVPNDSPYQVRSPYQAQSPYSFANTGNSAAQYSSNYPESASSESTSPYKGHAASSSGSTAGTAGLMDSYSFNDLTPPLDSPVANERTSYFPSPPKPSVPLPPAGRLPPLPPSRQASYSVGTGQMGNGGFSAYDPPIARPPSRPNQYGPQRTYSPAPMPQPTVQRQVSPAPLAQPLQNPFGATTPKAGPGPASYAPPSSSYAPSSTSYAPLSAPRAPVSAPYAPSALPPLPSNSLPPLPPLPLQWQPSPAMPGTPFAYQTNGIDRSMRPACAIATFAPGGKLLTCIPPPASNGAFMGYSATSSKTAVLIRSLPAVLGEEASGTSIDSFPGPLLGSTAGKSKNKKDALAWLSTRIADLEKAQSLVDAGTLLRSTQPDQLEDGDQEKVLLLKMLRIFVEHDGKLSGSAKLDDTVKETLLPNQATSVDTQEHFVTAAHLHQPLNRSRSPPIAVSELRASDLDKIQSLLLKGDRKSALRHSLDRQLWAHALIIATSLDKDAWKDVVSEFIKTDLAGTGQSKDKAALQVAYGLFAGLGASAVENVFPVVVAESRMSTPQPSAGLPVPLSTGPISRAPSPSVPAFPDLPMSSQPHSSFDLRDWQDILSVIMFNKTTSSVDTAALVSLGDALLVNGKVAASQICYLLALPSGSTGVSMGPRLCFLGHDFRRSSSLSTINTDALVMTEIFEFALSLAPAARGQEPFIGLPAFQAWRLVLAYRMTELGHTVKAQKYCEAITSTMKLATKSSPFYNWTLCHQIPALMDRVSGTPTKATDTGSWVSRTIQRPTLDSLWGTLEGRFTSFVAGEGAGEVPPPVKTKAPLVAVAAGPFANYSSISPAENGQISRTPSVTDLGAMQPQQAQMNGTSAYHPPAPSSYEAALPPLPNPSSLPPLPPLPKPSVAAPSPAARKAPPRAAHHQHSRSQSMGFLAYGSDPYASAPSWAPKPPTTPADVPEQEEEAALAEATQPPAEGSSWWSSSQNEQSFDTNRQPSFYSTSEAAIPEDETGFISPMGSVTPSTAAFSRQTTSTTTTTIDEDDDDLGFGNSSRRLRQQSEQPEQSKSDEGPGRSASVPPGGGRDQPQRQQLAAPPTLRSSSSFWGIGKLFKRDGAASPGPVQAKLGEESAFVYDPEQKRWINRKAGPSAETPAASSTPPPPPSRPQSAAPSMPSAPSASPTASFAPRNSAAGIGSTPPPPPSRVMSPAGSNEGVSSLHGPPPGLSARSSPDPSSMMPPPARRAASAAGKKARNKYIEIA